jgi:hypothetical protein
MIMVSQSHPVSTGCQRKLNALFNRFNGFHYWRRETVETVGEINANDGGHPVETAII